MSTNPNNPLAPPQPGVPVAPSTGSDGTPVVPSHEAFVQHPPQVHHANNVPLQPGTETLPNTQPAVAPAASQPVFTQQAVVQQPLVQQPIAPQMPVSQPLVSQPVGPQQVVPQQMVMQPVAPQMVPQQVAPQQVQQPLASTEPGSLAQPDEPLPDEVFLYSHSNLFYWWPVWAVGYLMAAVTYFGGIHENFSGTDVLIHPSKNLGVIFTLTFFLVILITNVTVRGVSSLVVIMGIVIVTLTLAYLNLWETVLSYFGRLEIYMNMGFYLFFSTAVFLVWAFSFFVYDRLTYWRVRPGQVTHETVIGGAETSYDTRGMVFEKHREDLFRHWVLGLGSGDMQFITTGARHETVSVPNVLFIDWKLRVIQRLIAMKPTGQTG